MGKAALTARGVPAAQIISEHFKYDLSGRSPQARRRRWISLGMSAAALAGLLLALAWRLL